jgi:mono/diheme cytochrome c family protein
MRNTFLKAGLTGAGALAVLVALSSGHANARPKYAGAFIEKYPNVTVEKTAKCAVCHGKDAEGKEDKKIRNEYGKAVGAALGAKNVKDAAEITAGLEKAEAASAGDGKTFGDYLKEGKIPPAK